jgi:predicted Zn-dependent peptidase
VHFSFAFPAVSIHHRLEPTWSLLGTWLGGGSSSLLFREVREKRGLSYSVYAGLSNFSDCGFLQGGFSTEPKNFKEAVSVVAECCRELSGGLLKENVEQTKAILEGSMLMGYDGIHHRMEVMAREELFLGHVVPLSHAIKEIRSIKVEHVNKLARELKNIPSCFVFGPAPVKKVNGLKKLWKGKNNK